MLAQESSRGFWFAAILLSFMTGAMARMPFLSDYGYGGNADALVAPPTDSALADSSGVFSAGVYPPEIPEDYSPETDAALLRKMRPGENPMHALNRLAKREKTTRTLLGTSLVVAGPVLIVGGFINLVGEDIFGDQGPLPELTFGLGFAGLGTGIYMLAAPWSAERRWKRASENILLGIRPDGRGGRLIVRF